MLTTKKRYGIINLTKNKKIKEKQKMDNKQFINNIEVAIEELENENVNLFHQEEFLDSMLVKSERYDGRFIANVLCDDMPENNVMNTLELKLFSVSNKRFELLAQMDLLKELKEEALQRIESKKLGDEFFKNLFE